MYGRCPSFFFHILLLVALFFILKFLLFFCFFPLKQLQIGQMLLASKGRFESVTSGRTKGKREEKSRRSPSSLIGSSPPGRKIVCTNIRTYTHTMHSLRTKTHKSSVQQPSSKRFLRFSLSPTSSFLPFLQNSDGHT